MNRRLWTAQELAIVMDVLCAVAIFVFLFILWIDPEIRGWRR